MPRPTEGAEVESALRPAISASASCGIESYSGQQVHIIVIGLDKFSSYRYAVRAS